MTTPLDGTIYDLSGRNGPLPFRSLSAGEANVLVETGTTQR
ncbi:hypothetical protein [Herbidospora mongoliensis]|nr:hypothetical protein [Herbidospora mongoliensis]